MDFQICVWASPAIDLIYSLYCDLSPENRQKHRDDYIRYYHEEFVKALKTFGYTKKPPSLLDIQVEVLKNGVLEVILSICFSVLLNIDWTTIEVNTLERSDAMKEIKRIAYHSEICQTALRQELPNFLHKGLI